MARLLHYYQEYLGSIRDTETHCLVSLSLDELFRITGGDKPAVTYEFAIGNVNTEEMRRVISRLKSAADIFDEICSNVTT